MRTVRFPDVERSNPSPSPPSCTLSHFPPSNQNPNSIQFNSMSSFCYSLQHLVSIGVVSKATRTRTAHQYHRSHQSKIRIVPLGVSSSMNKDDSAPMDYDAGELLGLDADIQPRNVVPAAAKLRSWFGPNGQYIRELPCPSCRGRGYTPCTECGIERSRSDCSQCGGKGIRTCHRCVGDCVIWEESIDERPWEKAQSSSPLKMKEDDEVDKMDIKVDVTRKSKRIYHSPSPEVSLKISRSLRSLNAKTGLFSKRMKIIHQDPVLHAQRVAAIKNAKGTDAARKQASEFMKAFFSKPENRLKRSIAMKGVKFYCSYCGEEGHRRHYCSTLRKTPGELRLRCRSCGERGHNRRTCGKLSSNSGSRSRRNESDSTRYCGLCGQSGHNRRTCPKLIEMGLDSQSSRKYLLISSSKKTYTCRSCLGKGHNVRTCPNKETI